MRRTLLLAAAIGALMLAPSIARAVPIPISGSAGLEGLGAFSGTFDYTATDDMHGTVDIVLSNDSLIAGYLTAFVFNIPTDAVGVSASLTSSNLNFSLLGVALNGVNGAPFGQFDIGASTFNSFEGGGNPVDGMFNSGPTKTATFSFALTATSGLGALTATDFLSTLSDGSTGAGEGVQAFVARFRGFDVAEGQPDSDKVPLGGTGAPVPEPGTLMLVGMGVASLVARRRLRP
jgi:hypothetical protein